jgi:hypothetical protein
MISIATDRALREVQKLPFCYACGEVFAATDERDRDHVPPKAGTALADRVVNQLILPSRKSCSSAYKIADERVGQFISLRHGRRPAKGKGRLNLRFFRDRTYRHFRRNSSGF